MKQSQDNSILFIDDSASEIEFLKLLFEIEKIPMVPQFMNNAKSALQYLEELEYEAFPKVIIVDINMPFMTGFEFAEIYSERFPDHCDTLLFIYSSSINSADIKKAESIKAVECFIPKPFSSNIFKETIQPKLLRERKNP